MDILENYPFPEIKGLAPVWTGKDFLLGTEKRSFLCYGQSQSGWSDELTELHEKEAGTGTHPIDIYSRYLAFNSVKSVVEKQGILLDVGCSSGFFLADIRKRYPHANLIGADYLPGIVRHCAITHLGTPILQFDLRACPLPDNSLDGVVALNVLEHIDEDGKALSHIFRILKPGGISHIEVPAGPHLYDFYDEALMHRRRYGKEQIIRKCQNAGFLVVREISLGWAVYPFFFVIKKRNQSQGRKMCEEEKRFLVSAAIQKTKTSSAFRFLLNLEKWMGKRLAFMPGVRHCVLLKKP